MSETKVATTATATVDKAGSDKLSTKSIPDKLGEADRLSKAKDIGKILSRAILHVHSLMKPAAKIRKVCEAGDTFLRAELDKVYGKSSRGLAIPTCISPNNIVANFIPANDGRDASVAAMVMDFAGGPRRPVLLRQGDLVKVQMGVHIDGQTILSTMPFVVHRAGAVENAIQAIAAPVASDAPVATTNGDATATAVTIEPLPLATEEPVADVKEVKVEQTEISKADKLLVECKKKFARDQIKDKRANLVLALQTAAKCVTNCITPTTTLEQMKQLIDFVATEYGCFALVDTRTSATTKSNKDVNVKSDASDASRWDQLSRLGKYRLYGQPFTELKKASKPLPDKVEDGKTKSKGKKRGKEIKKSDQVATVKVDDKAAEVASEVEVKVDDKAKEELWLVTITMSTANETPTPARDMKPMLYVRDKETPFVSLKNKMSRPMLADISKLLGADTEAKNGYPFRVDQLLNLSSQNSAALKSANKVTSGKFIKPLKLKTPVNPPVAAPGTSASERKDKLDAGKVSVRLGLKELMDRKLIQPIHAVEVEEGEYGGQLSFSLFKRANGEFFCLTDPIGIMDPLLKCTIPTTTTDGGANVVSVGIDTILNAGSKVRAFKY